MSRLLRRLQFRLLKQRLMETKHLNATKKPGNNYDINWASVLLSGDTRETVLSLAAIAPEAISKKMKGRYLEEEPGL
jgi:hypothetical protein